MLDHLLPVALLPLGLGSLRKVTLDNKVIFAANNLCPLAGLEDLFLAGGKVALDLEIVRALDGFAPLSGGPSLG